MFPIALVKPQEVSTPVPRITALRELFVLIHNGCFNHV